MGRVAVGCVLVALLAAPAICAAARRAPAGRAVAVYVDGERVGPTDQTTGAPLNAFMVGDVPVLPVRLFTAALGDHLDLYLWRWQVFQLTGSSGVVAFRLGDKVASLPTPAVAGTLERPLQLPLAPRLVDGHLYVPAEPVLKELGHDGRWDPKTRTLRITKQRQASPSAPQ